MLGTIGAVKHTGERNAKTAHRKTSHVIGALVEGNSINATARMTSTSKITVLRLLVDVGTFCGQYHDLMVRDLAASGSSWTRFGRSAAIKTRPATLGLTVSAAYGHGWGSMRSKLCISYLVGLRDQYCAQTFVNDVAERLADRVQLTSDGFGLYVDAVEENFRGQDRLRPANQAVRGRQRG